ncbi:MAG: class II aldolase/adducin family protein [Candidatus Zixiibacteriota bacterium]
MTESSLIVNKIVEIGRNCYQRGLIAGSDGNISARIDANRIAITRSGVCKGHLTEQDIVIIDSTGKPLSASGKPSSETLMHLFLYDKRPDIQACVHAHPPFATAFAVAGIPLEKPVLPEVVLFVGNIALTEFAFPGTPAVAQSLEPTVANHNAFLLKNHGLTTVGATLDEAFYRLETVEHFAQIYYRAKMLGNVDILQDEDVARLIAIRETTHSATKENS